MTSFREVTTLCLYKKEVKKICLSTHSYHPWLSTIQTLIPLMTQKAGDTVVNNATHDSRASNYLR